VYCKTCGVPYDNQIPLLALIFPYLSKTTSILRVSANFILPGKLNVDAKLCIAAGRGPNTEIIFSVFDVLTIDMLIPLTSGFPETVVRQ